MPFFIRRWEKPSKKHVTLVYPAVVSQYAPLNAVRPAIIFSFFHPAGKAGGRQIRRCQGIAVTCDGFTLGALALTPGFCNVTAQSLDNALVNHCVDDLHETGDVGAIHVISGCAILLGGIETSLVNTLHDHL